MRKSKYFLEMIIQRDADGGIVSDQLIGNGLPRTSRIFADIESKGVQRGLEKSM